MLNLPAATKRFRATRCPAGPVIVRLWGEAGSDQAGDSRGQVEHVQTGGLRHFREMDKVLDFIAGHLEGAEEEQTTT